MHIPPGGGGGSLLWAKRGGSTQKACLFQARSIKGRDNCHFSAPVTNQLQSEKNGGKREAYQRVPHFGRNDHATESERLKTGENVGIIRNSVVLDYP